jgi:Pyruvate/2-oxoglutarate dehydrogenase complex, dehydrogenase (E1) component, eukaryotic type, alpha subunit
MSNHFAKMEWNIENISSATGTQDLHAVGVARAMVYYGHKGVVITSHGEASVSEGFVYEAINGASTECLPVIFVIQDNGLVYLFLKKIRLPIVRLLLTFPDSRT